MKRYQSIDEIIRTNVNANQKWFSPSTMEFFRSRVISTAPIEGRFFITSEQVPHNDHRKYTLRVARADGRIDTVGPFYAFNDPALILQAFGIAKKTLPSPVDPSEEYQNLITAIAEELADDDR